MATMHIPRTPDKKAVVVIGAAFTGPAGFADTRTGTYWESMPQMEGDNLLLQEALLAYAREEKLIWNWRNFQRWPNPPQCPPFLPAKPEK